MVTAEAVTPIIDQVIALFNKKAMDLPDGFFARQTQFVLNGAPFETLLGQPPSDPLVLMLTRGPAGYRFACKGLQHAMPDAALERGEITAPAEGDRVTARLWLSGHLHTTGEALDTVVTWSFASRRRDGSKWRKPRWTPARWRSCARRGSRPRAIPARR